MLRQGKEEEVIKKEKTRKRQTGEKKEKQTDREIKHHEIYFFPFRKREEETIDRRRLLVVWLWALTDLAWRDYLHSTERRTQPSHLYVHPNQREEQNRRSAHTTRGEEPR